MSFVRPFLQDTMFSVLITAVFLRPILRVLREGRGVANQSAGYTSMMITKCLTLAGSIITVFSSTGLYVDAILYTVYGGYGEFFWTNPYANPNVFGINADAVLNGVGMLLACGVFKKVSCGVFSELVSTRKITLRSAREQPVAPEPEKFQFNSRAYEND